MPANPAAPTPLEPYILGFPAVPRGENVWQLKFHQITHVSPAQTIQTAGLLSCPPARTPLNTSRALLIAPRMGCADPHSKEFQLLSHERPAQGIKAEDQDMLMLSLLQTKLMLFKPWSHRIPLLLQGLVLGEHRGMWEFHTPATQKMRF